MQIFSSRKNEQAKPTAEPETSMATPAPSNRATPTVQSGGILSSSVSIKGTVKFRNELQIDGEIEGKIDSSGRLDRKSTRLNSSHQIISYAVFCLKKKRK